MNPNLKVISTFAGLPAAIVVLACTGVTSRPEALRSLATCREALEESKPKTVAQSIVYLWAHGVVDDDSALDGLADVPGGEQWADVVMGWTPDERRAAVERLEAQGWTRETLDAIS